MELRDFISRQNHDYSNGHEIIPMFFNMQYILQANLGESNIREIFSSNKVTS